MRTSLLSFLLLAAAFQSSSLEAAACTPENKQKATYAYPHYSPSFSQANPLDVEWIVKFDNVTKEHTYGRNGIFMALNAWFGHGVPSGYVGPQSKGDTSSEKDQVLFSLWDYNSGQKGWQAALPQNKTFDGSACYRNCQDCSVDPNKSTAPDGSTGTQCSLHIPTIQSGQSYQLKWGRVEQNVQESMYGQTWTGDVWRATIQQWSESTGAPIGPLYLIGTQLLGGVTGATRGVSSFSFFREFLGCTDCDAFDITSSLKGPWIRNPSTSRLQSVSSVYNCDVQCNNCTQHSITSPGHGEVEWKAGPSVAPASGDGTWNKVLYTCESSEEGWCSPPSSV